MSAVVHTEPPTETHALYNFPDCTCARGACGGAIAEQADEACSWHGSARSPIAGEWHRVEYCPALQPAPVPLVRHVGRSWSGTYLEDPCPCPKAACGLVIQEEADPACDQHPVNARKTMRQRHAAGDCPGHARPTPLPELSPREQAERRKRRLERLWADEERQAKALDRTRELIRAEADRLVELTDRLTR
ncbi:hypothetical protein [Streptacidiphilus sp. EB129]|uniref:hypothetical protein n=1 Tax=Streptacidiphilus sp. EB129 TaxID=3156262 RepID=UPI0035121E05